MSRADDLAQMVRWNGPLHEAADRALTELAADSERLEAERDRAVAALEAVEDIVARARQVPA